jgi:hypothetical protein
LAKIIASQSQSKRTEKEKEKRSEEKEKRSEENEILKRRQETSPSSTGGL